MIASGHWKRRGRFLLLAVLVGVGVGPLAPVGCHLGSSKPVDQRPDSKPAVTGNKGFTFVWAPVSAIASQPRSIAETIGAVALFWLLRRYRLRFEALRRLTGVVETSPAIKAVLGQKLELCGYLGTDRPDAVEKELRRVCKHHAKRPGRAEHRRANPV
jgi:hypothetical protein